MQKSFVLGSLNLDLFSKQIVQCTGIYLCTGQGLNLLEIWNKVRGPCVAR
jgi:hypothetical protein